MRKFVAGTFGSRILGACGASIVWTLAATKAQLRPCLSYLLYTDYVIKMSMCIKTRSYVRREVGDACIKIKLGINLADGVERDKTKQNKQTNIKLTMITIIFQMKNCGRRKALAAVLNPGCFLVILFAFLMTVFFQTFTSFKSFHSCSELKALALMPHFSSLSSISWTSELSRSLTNVMVKSCNHPQSNVSAKLTVLLKSFFLFVIKPSACLSAQRAEIRNKTINRDENN
jgi:hypothetical protein